MHPLGMLVFERHTPKALTAPHNPHADPSPHTNPCPSPHSDPNPNPTQEKITPQKVVKMAGQAHDQVMACSMS